jgi:DnaK suppressor protein
MTRKPSQEDRRRYEVLSRMLTDRQSEIRNKLRSLRQALPAELAQVRDAEEQSMEEFVLGMDFALMEMESQTLRKIDDALLRLEEGSYGVCAECDEAISEARLRALPFAGLCRDCQAQHEDEVAQRNARPSRFFEDGPPPAPRERRPAAAKAPKREKTAWGFGQPAGADGEAHALRVTPPSRRARV